LGWIELFAIAVVLSVDAFAVAACKGVQMGKAKIRYSVVVGLYFGGFQALMPTAGYLLGTGFVGAVEAFDHWIAFALLSFIGVRMILNARKTKAAAGEVGSAAAGAQRGGELAFSKMLPLAVATSIDALAVGVTFAFLDVMIVPAALAIGCVTFLISAVGVAAGGFIGEKYRTIAEIAGGAVLIFLGARILAEHFLSLG
jgi:putative Mn2+ efflux pump MntP